MDAFVHIIIFLVAVGIIWFFAGILVEAISRIARRYCKSGFFTAFFILGFLTSISEFSVAVNAVVRGVPGVSAGNLIGASFVILLLIVPMLAVAGRGIYLNGAVSKGTLGIILAAVILPAVLVLDGDITRTEGLLSLLAYGTVVFALYRKRASIQACDPSEEGVIARMRSTAIDISRVVMGAVAIFIAAHFLVEQAVYFAGALSVPNSLVGLLVLSVGTNVPELVIALRSVLRGRSDIAFGDYLGSAAMNTCIFGGLAMTSGTFGVEASEFIMTAILFVSGLGFLFLFASSRLMISRREGAFLLLFYIAFFLLQTWNVFRFAA